MLWSGGSNAEFYEVITAEVTILIQLSEEKPSYLLSHTNMSD